MKTLFKERKELILQALGEFLLRKDIKELLNLKWEKQLPEKLVCYTAGGKCLRGNLVLLGFEAAGGDLSKAPSLCKAAAAIELFQSGILMHDDIIDGDALRRGKSSMHVEFAGFLKDRNISRPEKTGESMAICLGDIALMLTFALLNETECPPEILRRVNVYWGCEFAKVGAAEMEDTYLSGAQELPGVERILALYRGKTAGYTFTLPLLTGAMLVGADEKLLERLREYALALGVLFQVKDDELGIYGDAEKLGKPVGSDIREGKKTVFWQMLLEAASLEEREELKGIFGNPAPSMEMVERVRYLLEAKGIRSKVAALAESLALKARKALEGFDGPRREILLDLVEMSLERKA
ncbi:polyprenyl synthetase family protein [bacterium]|nr:polyprenyl synthetase family protein [bacterium]